MFHQRCGGKKSECAFEYFSTMERGREEAPLVALFSILPEPDAIDNHCLRRHSFACPCFVCLFLLINTPLPQSSAAKAGKAAEHPEGMFGEAFLQVKGQSPPGHANI